MQMCPFCDKVYDESEYCHCPYCSDEFENETRVRFCPNCGCTMYWNETWECSNCDCEICTDEDDYDYISN